MRFFAALLVLVASVQLALSGSPSCSLQGELINGACACYSAFTGPTCDVDSTGACTLPTVAPLATQVVGEFQVPQDAISGNNFTFFVESPATSGRYFSSISLNGNVNCSFPGSHFAKTFAASPDCKDVYTGSFQIPEIVDVCGFDQNTAAGFTTLSGSVDVTAVDYINSFRGHPIFRTTTSSLALDLKLPTFVNLTTTQLSIFSPINVLAAVTRQEYSYQDDEATIQLTTSVQWPFQLKTPNVTLASQLFSSTTAIADDSCLQGSGDCLQITTITISGIRAALACNFDGAYSLSFTYDCRSGQVPCPVSGADTAEVAFNLTSGDICASAEIVASISGELRSYTDNTFATERLVIVAGERIYLKAALISDVSIQSISVHELRVVQNGVPQILVIDDTPDSRFPSIAYDGTEGTVASNELGLSFLASSDVFFSNDQDAVFAFTVEADLTITYKTTFGRKRDTQATTLTFGAQVVLLKN